MSNSISVILPVYNAEKYLEESLESIWAQTLPPQEVIAINDGSTDNSLEILNKFSHKLRIVSRENRGICASLNQAIQLAKGELITFLDADDMWVDDKLEQQVRLLTQRPDLEACFGMMQQFISPELPEEVQQTIYCPNEVQKGIVKLTLMVWRKSFDRIGWFDETLKRGDFIDWFSRAEEAGLTYTVLPELFAHRRLHRNSLSSQQQHQKDLLKVAKAALDRRRAAC
ncbi:glycosyltransferase family A protein [Tellurirhabdus bombi]|uniref:glycosyltransferase family A protein n=1 Tax=Tellurirhabdus bombi TaxID=2907205 RepID=UPI001F162D7F|nr:glycosyltransferase family A protein [Tellurirhabdus bombi]